MSIFTRKPRRHRPDRQGEEGFTLVEVIVVISIIGLFMSLVGPRVLNYLTDSKLKAARIQAETLGSAVELFFIDIGRYPLEAEGLDALVRAPRTVSLWNGPYLKGNSVPRDPWGNPYIYASPDKGRSFTITFAGQDGVRKTGGARVAPARNAQMSSGPAGEY
ncbi:MAG: gspG [Hyphomicrobiales bacterium]|nr:gspG [Hyphomicrobiales bacterium]